jgi:peptidoglycan/xylan/chitin deacetylase (PgdA/CDA1 family)
MGVSVSVDVDGVAGLACRAGGPWEGRLSARSLHAYGTGRGLERVLAVLDAFAVRATFYVPGITLERHPGTFAEVAAAGHELGHHGYRHLPTHTLDAAGERDELQRGLAAFADRLGLVPAGYRSPAWELTPHTLTLLGEHQFAYDSSLMGDDRPYRIRAGPRELIELPVHWDLDDVPYAGAHHSPRHVLAIWTAEADHARAEQRHLTYTIHPDITGRPHRLALLQGLLEHLHAHDTPTHTHAEVARRL